MEGFSKPPSINQEDPHDEERGNPNCANFLLLPLRIFVDLIIGKAVRPPSSDRHFFVGLQCAADAPKVKRSR